MQTSLKKLMAVVRPAALVLGALSVSLVAGELAFRAIDGFELTGWRLIRRLPAADHPKSQDVEAVRRYIPMIPTAPAMQVEWFDLSPELRPSSPPDAVLLAATELFAARGIGAEAIRVLNWHYVRNALCQDVRFRHFPGFIFAFDAPEAAGHPAYRFPRNAVTPNGLVTNRFGWRGPQIELVKRARTIRIAFVGASTTVNEHGYPFSYPELAGFWLNRWLEAQGSDVRVESINAGREGISSPDIAAVVRDELLPLQPDLVVYYEGSNQFHMDGIVRFTNVFRTRRAILNSLHNTERSSAIARRLAELVRLTSSGAFNTDYEIRWPEGVDEGDPPIHHPGLPADLSRIVRDLEDMETRLRLSGSELVPSSFFWLAFEDLNLDPVRDRTIIEYFSARYFPFRARDIQRVADFQNRVFSKFAASRGLHFIDVAARMPRDPNLFADPIHATYQGVRLHAWIVAQQLAPLLAQRITAGRLPRPWQGEASSHPAFPGNERTVTFECPARPTGGSRWPIARVFADGLAVPPLPPMSGQSDRTPSP